MQKHFPALSHMSLNTLKAERQMDYFRENKTPENRFLFAAHLHLADHHFLSRGSGAFWMGNSGLPHQKSLIEKYVRLNSQNNK